MPAYGGVSSMDIRLDYPKMSVVTDVQHTSSGRQDLPPGSLLLGIQTLEGGITIGCTYSRQHAVLSELDSNYNYTAPQVQRLTR